MHDCSHCGCACYCHGDIDDCQVETIEYAFMHCTGCGCGPGEFDDEYYDDPGEHEDDVQLRQFHGDPHEAEWEWIVRAHDEHIAR